MMLLPKLRAWQWIVLVLVLAFAVDWFIQRPDDKARALNAAIAAQASSQLKAYPYPFRVLRTEGGTAVMGTPRNRDVSVAHVIKFIHPEVNVMNSDDAAFIAAQRNWRRCGPRRNIVAGSQA